ncbi:MAG TPA: DUF5658 family protein [Tepidisphaeraceae bacterium]|jgi:hypothetical protein
MNAVLPIQCLEDARSRRFAELLGILWILALADLLFTLWAHFYTPFTELNPWASTLLAHHRVMVLSGAKVSLTIFGTLILWSLRRYRSAELALWIVVAVYVALMFRWSDYTVEVLATGLVGT